MDHVSGIHRIDSILGVQKYRRPIFAESTKLPTGMESKRWHKND